MITSLAPATITLIVLIGGLLTPLVTALLNKEHWPSELKQIVCMIVSAGVAVAAVAIDQPTLLRAPTLFALFALIYAWAQVTYGLIWKTTPIAKTLLAIGSPKVDPVAPTPTAPAESIAERVYRIGAAAGLAATPGVQVGAPARDTTPVTPPSVVSPAP